MQCLRVLHPFPLWQFRCSSSIVALAGLHCQARHEVKWGGARATQGVREGRVYFEALLVDEGLCRVGWSLKRSSLDLGTQLGSFGYGGTGKKSTRRQFKDYGGPYGQARSDTLFPPSMDHLASH